MWYAHSDHVPLLLQMDAGSGARIPKRRPHKFEEKWALHPECEKIIQEMWTEDGLRGSPMFDLCEKIKRCRERLHGWFRDVSNEFQSKIKAFTNTLTQLITSNTSGQNTEVIALTKAMINNLLLSEEVHWRQRSRMM